MFVHVLNKPKGFTQRLQFYQESCMCLDFLLKPSTCRVCVGEFWLFFFLSSLLRKVTANVKQVYAKGSEVRRLLPRTQHLFTF